MKKYSCTTVFLLFLLQACTSLNTSPQSKKPSIFSNMNPLETQRATNCYLQLGNSIQVLAEKPKLRTFFLEVSKQKGANLPDAINSAYNGLVKQSLENFGNEEALLPEKEDFNEFAEVAEMLKRACSGVKESNFTKIVKFFRTRISKLKIKVKAFIPRVNGKDAQNLKTGVQRKVKRFFKNVKKVFVVIGIVTIFIPAALILIPSACTGLAVIEIIRGIAEFLSGEQVATEDREDRSTYLFGLMACMEFLGIADLMGD